MVTTISATARHKTAYSFRVDLLCEPSLDQRLIRHVALVGGGLDALEQSYWQMQDHLPGCRSRSSGLRLKPLRVDGKPGLTWPSLTGRTNHERMRTQLLRQLRLS